MFEYSPQDVLTGTVEIHSQTPHTESLWRIELRCVHENCERHYAIWTSYLENASDEDAGAIVLSKYVPACGHDLRVFQVSKWKYFD